MMMFFALALAQAASAPVDCASAITQQDMNRCAGEDFAKADAEMNAQWEVTAAAMRDRDGVGNLPAADDQRAYFAHLLAAQRAWLAYRDAQCANEGYQVEGGSMQPMVVNSCLADLTRQRTTELRSLIDGEA